MQSNLTGIIIDDDYDEVDVLSMFLEIKGYDVVGKGRNGYDVVGKGRNGYDVVTLYEKNNPDFVILGVNMSQCAGTHAIEEIKKINYNANIFVLANPKFKDFGNDVIILSKPCDFYEILESIEMNCMSNLI
jgi:YesN/AraC family two-component response regulator